MQLSSICVYCGSSAGSNPVWQSSAFAFGETLAEQNIKLIYGGGSVGLMGAVADGVLSKNGTVIGVIPEPLKARELDHKNATEMHVVANMHQRKQLMADLSDAFVALPGGIGTLDELFEIFTWKQLSIHQNPCGILNVAGYYDHLLKFLDHSVESAFLRQEHLKELIVETETEALLTRLRSDTHLAIGKWI